MKLSTRGLKSTDLDIDLGPLSVLVAPNASGKSTAAIALRFLALGYEPALGRVDKSVAALMRGREMSVALTLDDGRTVTRTLARTAKGGYEQTVQCSWLKGATSTEAAAAVLNLFGTEEQEVVECLDIRELLNATGPQRAAKIEALIASANDPADVAYQVAGYTVQRLAGISDERMPAEFRDVLRSGLVSPERVDVLKASGPMLLGKIKEAGIGGALTWARSEKTRATAEIKPKRAAADEYHARVRDLPDPAPEHVAGLETRRGEIERAIGATEQQAKEATRQRDAVADAARQLTTCEAQLRTAHEARELCERLAADATAKRFALGVAEQGLASLTAPPMPDFGDVERLEAEAALAYILSRSALPTPIDAGRERALVAGIKRKLAEADASPWQRVTDIATEVVAISPGSSERCRRLHALAGELTSLATEHGACDVATLRTDLADAETIMAAAIGREAESAAEVARLDAERTAHADRDRKLRDSAAAIRRGKKAAHEAARANYDQRYRELTAEIDAAKKALDGLDERERRTATAVASAEAALIAARQRVSDLTADIADAVADPAELRAELASVTAELAALVAATTTRAELQRLIGDLARLEAERDVYAATEWACSRVRDESLQDAGGPLTEHMRRFLAGAGRTEAPYVGKGGEIGWRVPGGGEVAVQVMSGAEWAIYSAALASAVIALRGAPMRLLIVESGECDDTRMGQLMRGIGAVADTITHAIVLSWAEPPRVAGWDVIRLGERAEEVEAA